MGIQGQMLLQYLIYLKGTEENRKTRDEKILKAVNDYYLGKNL